MTDYDFTRHEDYLDLLDRYGLPRNPDCAPDSLLDDRLKRQAFWKDFDERKRLLESLEPPYRDLY